MCVLCLKEEESINHLFLWCEFAKRIWNRISSTRPIFGPRYDSVTSAFFEWKSMNCFLVFQGGSKFVLHSFVWYIWLERNDNNKSSREIQVFYRVMLNVGR
ncbi:hypothetical protein LINPERPRIM_LOCUS22693 [Linum perenne]